MTTPAPTVSPTHYMKQGDLLPAVHLLHLFNGDGTVVDLTDAESVTFNMSDRDGNVLIERGTVTIIDAAESEVQYDWQLGDTDLDPGTYLAEMEVTFPGSKPARFPNGPDADSVSDIQVVISTARG